jgi:hypothetical protein
MKSAKLTPSGNGRPWRLHHSWRFSRLRTLGSEAPAQGRIGGNRASGPRAAQFSRHFPRFPFPSPEVHNKIGIIVEHGDGYVITVEFTDWSNGVPCEFRAK